MNDFYDRLAPFYSLIYEDWDAAIAQQANQLSHLIQQNWGTEVKTVLDVSCGIGTQALGLAALGYQVTASDLSAGEIHLARQEANRRRLNIPFSVCDMRQVDQHYAETFDALISCDNSVPHLLTDAAILQALQAFRNCIKPGGGCLITLRDYDREPCGRGIVKPYGLREMSGKRYLLFQVWDFDGDWYDLAFYFLEEDRQTQQVQTHVMRSRYYAIRPDHLAQLMEKAGFVQVMRLDNRYFQPVIVGTQPLIASRP